MLNEITNNFALSGAIIFALGLAVGSFLNVVIYRLPIMLREKLQAECEEFLEQPKTSFKEKIFNLLRPRSHCPKCQTAIAIRHNFPLLSFIFLKGKCAHCLEPISWRYPLVELISTLLSVTMFYHFGWSLALLGALIFGWLLIALAFIDYDKQILPDELTLTLVWLGLLFNAQVIFVSASSAIIGAACGYLALWLIAKLFFLLRKKEGLGYGDFKLCAAFGAWLGWQMLPLILLIASLLGTIVGVTLVLLKKHETQKPLPFGPFLIAAALLTLFYGQNIWHWYLGGL